MDPFPPLNSLSKGGIVCISLMSVFGIPSIACTGIAWGTALDDYPYVTEYSYNRAAEAAALATGACSLIAAIIAYPLTYKGAERYMKQRNSTGIKGLMITAWVFYGILIVTGIAMIAVGAGQLVIVGPLWVTFEVLWGLAGWIMMFVHANKARKSPSTSVLPRFKESTKNPNNSLSPDTWITVKTTINKDGTQTRETNKHTKNPDGSVTVETTVEETDASEW